MQLKDTFKVSNESHTKGYKTSLRKVCDVVTMIKKSGINIHALTVRN